MMVIRLNTDSTITMMASMVFLLNQLPSSLLSCSVDVLSSFTWIGRISCAGGGSEVFHTCGFPYVASSIGALCMDARFFWYSWWVARSRQSSQTYLVLRHRRALRATMPSNTRERSVPRRNSSVHMVGSTRRLTMALQNKSVALRTTQLYAELRYGRLSSGAPGAWNH